MKKVLIVLFIISMLIIIACSNKVQSEIKEDIECNDNNNCTNDSFDITSNTCVYNKILNCCGNDICEASERCNIKDYTTTCKVDCASCPATIKVNGPLCDSGCSYAGTLISVNGDTKLHFILENIGEESTEVKSLVKCAEGNSGGNINFNYYGVEQGLYFDNGLDAKVIEGKSSENVILEFIGLPTKGVLLNCDLVINYDNKPPFISLFKLKIKQYSEI